MDMEEAAQRLRVSRRTMQRYVSEGRIDVVRTPGRTLITEAAIHEFIARHTDQATA
jgi:excisionase family DNA binding protein